MKITKPQIFQKQTQAPKSARVINAFDSALVELFFIEQPKYKKGTPEAKVQLKKFLANHKIKPIWIYYAWQNLVVKTVPEDIYFKLRTARNKHLITEAEQINYRQSQIGVAGLSMGSSVLSVLVISGGPQSIKLADFDHLEITNLNRIKAKLQDVGQNKTTIAAQNTWELDPFADLELWPKGLTRDNLEKFILKPKLDVFIDAMDSLDLKILARLICQQHKIPVLMATDIGDTVLLDIERYDLEPTRQLFHGLAGEINMADFDEMNPAKWLQLSTKIIGPEYMPDRLQQSVLEVGQTLDTIPRLGTTGASAGSAISFAIRRITNQQPMPSGRYVISLEEKLIPGYLAEEQKKQRADKTQNFIKQLGKPR